MDAGLAQIAEILLVLLDLLIAARQVERHFGHVVHARIADVPHRDPGVLVTLLDLEKTVRRAQLGRRADADVLGADLFQELQLIVGRIGGRLHAELYARHALGLGGRRLTPERGCAQRSKREATELSTTDVFGGRTIRHVCTPSQSCTVEVSGARDGAQCIGNTGGGRPRCSYEPAPGQRANRSLNGALR